MGGQSDAEVRKHASGLGRGGEVLPQNLPWSFLDVQQKLPSWGAQLGRDGLEIWVSVEVLGVGRKLT